jgi:Family of unknown function (DUF6152)
VVTKVEWTNPHAHFYMEVKDACGYVANLNLELASPNVLIRNGWKRNSINLPSRGSASGGQTWDEDFERCAEPASSAACLYS